MDTLAWQSWLQKVCGQTDSGYKLLEEREQAKTDFLQASVGPLMSTPNKDATRDLLQSVKLRQSGQKNLTDVLGASTKRKWTISRDGAVVSIARKDVLRNDVMAKEYDSFDDKASGIKSASIDGETVDLKTDEGRAFVERIKAAIQPYLDISADMAKDGLFTPREIEAEVWAPLVRQGVIPSNLVPDDYSEITRALLEGNEVYKRLMDREDGTSMGSDPVGLGIAGAKHLVSFVKVAGDGIMHNLSVDGFANIAEASRQDFAQFINARDYKINLEEDALRQVRDLRALVGVDGVVPKDADAATLWEQNEAALKRAGIGDQQALQEVMDNDQHLFEIEMIVEAYDGEAGASPAQVLIGEFEESGQGDFGEWLDGQLNGGIDASIKANNVTIADLQADLCAPDLDLDGALEIQARIEELELKNDALSATAEHLGANPDLLAGMDMMHSFGKHLQYKAVQNIAGTLMSTGVEMAEKIHEKKAKRDVGLTLANGLADVMGEVVKSFDFDNGAMELKTAGERLEKSNLDLAHDSKYYTLAAKAGAAALVQLGTALESEAKGKPSAGHFQDFVASMLNGMGEAVSGLGSNDGSMPSLADKSDTRAEYASLGMIPKAAAVVVKSADRLMAAWNARDKTALMAELSVLMVGGASAGMVGMIGNWTREDLDLRDIAEGWNGDDAGEVAVSPFIEISGAGGQTEFGMNGDLATVNDQRAALDETLSLFDEVADDATSVPGRTDPTVRQLRKGVDAAIGTLQMMVPPKPAQGDDPDAAARDILDKLKALKIERTAPEAVRALLLAARQPIEDAITAARQNAQRVDAELLTRLSDDVDKKELGKDIDKLRGMLDGIRTDAMPDPDAVEALIVRIQAQMTKDPAMMADIQAEIAAEERRFEDLRKRADMTRLEALENPEDLAAAKADALNAITEITRQLKKDEMKLKLADKATKGALGLAAAAVPGAGLAMKLRDLTVQIASAEKRRRDLAVWNREQKAMAGNYSVFESVARAETSTLGQLYATDIVEAVATSAGVVAETMRLIDHTHATAGAMHTLEKAMKASNSLAKDILKRSAVSNGWKAYKKAIDNPANRRAAREAIEANATLAKCVLAYGAVKDKDQQAISAVQACGLSAAVLEDDNDVCDAAVNFLRARLSDKEHEIIADAKLTDWLPCAVEPKLKSWIRIKSEAMELRPALSEMSFASTAIDEALRSYEYAVSDLEAADGAARASAMKVFRKACTGLGDSLAKWTPLDGSRRPHRQMIEVRDRLAASLGQPSG